MSKGIKVNKEDKIKENIKVSTRYEAESNGCKIIWSLAYPTKDKKRFGLKMTNKECSLTFEKALPIHKAILKKIFQENKIENGTLFWSGFDPKTVGDWSWAIPIAMASNDSNDWQNWRKNYPNVDKSSNQIFIEITNSVNAYAPLKILFKDYGYDLKLSSVEKVFAQRAKDLKFYDELKAKGIKGNPKLTYDVGVSYFEFIKK